ncbi:MAG TPA: phosphate ABC transporter substrate-binding/OmpA family protein [Tepidisphaeraceae bacterium]|nr:phosphate ABC transporter substrate-binding/OmpA family protein [Tepidisphaeraceae bacterium]
MSEQRTGTGLTILGKLLTVLLIAGLIAGGFYLIKSRGAGGGKTAGGDATAKTGGDAKGSGAREATGGDGENAAAVPAEIQTEVPRLDPAAPYVPKDNTVLVELSEYAGYAGMIAANGGLEPSEDSVFFKKHGFKVRLALSEEESWSKLNRGEMGASATTVDVLAVYGKQFQVNVPALIGFSRGADAVVVRSDIKRINQLKGKVLATSQFTEAEFFIRYLAQEAGIPVTAIANAGSAPNPEAINLVYAEDGPAAGDLFLEDLNSGGNKLAGFVAWAPKTTEVAEGSGGKARILTSNRNLLIIADILIVNRGFAEANPKMVAGLVDGLLEGNRMVRDNPSPQTIDVVANAFKWSAGETKEELAKVHPANLPENLAFFSGAIDAAGSFEGIFQSAVLAYGRDIIKDPAPAKRFIELAHLQALEESGAYKDQKVAIAPIRSSGAAQAVEENPLLSKDIRFTFVANKSELDLTKPENLARLESIKEMLKVSPGSVVLLRGHVDDALVPEFKKRGESFLRNQSLRATQLSQERADEIKRLLVERQNVDPKRIDTQGLGWAEPVEGMPANTPEESERRSEANRRVEAQWFTLE